MASIVDIRYALPVRRETNAELQHEHPAWRMDGVFDKSGIWSRPIAAAGETASDLSFAAASELLAATPDYRESIDYVINCTQTPDYILPTTACILQHRLGLASTVGAIDFNLGCSGYLYGLQIADALILSGYAKNVLLLTGDTYSKLISPKDRTVRALFGDGAAATVLSEGRKGLCSIGNVTVGTDGAGSHSLIVPSGGQRLPKSSLTSIESTDDAGCVRSQDNLYMDGPAIFSFVISAIPRLLKDFLSNSQMDLTDVDYFVFHQANKYMLESLARACGIPQDKLVIDVHDCGNLVSASIPIAVHRAATAGRFKCGDRLILCGFGVGYSWGICQATWH